mmetsp:Transcript_7320/g.18314  ORF Transcript_7320/g.18314 Transcript_7320/m.18314 type:complete len:211 (-) Transcript_7320:612-1244(-)
MLVQPRAYTSLTSSSTPPPSGWSAMASSGQNSNTADASYHRGQRWLAETLPRQAPAIKITTSLMKPASRPSQQSHSHSGAHHRRSVRRRQLWDRFPVEPDDLEAPRSHLGWQALLGIRVKDVLQLCKISPEHLLDLLVTGVLVRVPDFHWGTPACMHVRGLGSEPRDWQASFAREEWQRQACSLKQHICPLFHAINPVVQLILTEDIQDK